MGSFMLICMAYIYYNVYGLSIETYIHVLDFTWDLYTILLKDLFQVAGFLGMDIKDIFGFLVDSLKCI